MCSSKVFGGSKTPKVEPPPAAPVAAPNSNIEASTSTGGEDANVRAKGKKKLTISKVGSAGTGVNL